MGSTTAKDQKLVNYFDEYYGNLENPLYCKVMRVFYLSMYVHYDRRANLWVKEPIRTIKKSLIKIAKN